MSEDYDKRVAGERVRAFVEDEYVKRALVAMEQDAMRAFKQATDDNALRMAQAQSKVTDTFVFRLLGMVEEGTLARTDQA